MKLNTFRIRCLVALYHNAPEAMEAGIRYVPPDQGDDVVVVARSVRVDWGSTAPEPFGDVERDHLPVEFLCFHAPPNHLRREPDNLNLRAAYDRETNTIHLVSVK